MIVVKLMGGLGNQMFQFAAGLSLAQTHNTNLLIDTSFLNKDANGQYTQRFLELSNFNVDITIASEKETEPFLQNKKSKIKRFLQRKFPNLFSNMYAAESGMAFQTSFFNYPKNTYLDGFWQSEMYFKNITDTIISCYKPKETINNENINWLNKIESCQSVSLHIRRGDYLSNKNALNHHGICELDYYNLAVNFIKQKYSNITIFVFSDDLQWCKSNLNFNTSINFVDANQKENMHLDIMLMSKCKHNIIANSSFSWWGAWLNQHNNKMVIAPKKWFLNSTINTTDLIPNTWVKL